MASSTRKHLLFRLVTYRLTWVIVSLISVAFYLGSWPIFYNFLVLPKAIPEKGGLQVNVFNRPEIKGKPVRSFVNYSDKLILEKPNTSLLAYGLWKVPQPGHYRIHLECDDFGSMNLDGQALIQLTGINARNIGEIEIELKAGYHLMVLRLFNKPGKGWFTLNIIHPNKNESLLNTSSLIYLDLPNLNRWLLLVKGFENGGKLLLIFSIGIIISLVFIHSSPSKRKIIPPEIDFPLRATLLKRDNHLGRQNKFVFVSFLISFIIIGLIYHYILYKQTIPILSQIYFKDHVTLFDQALSELKPFLPTRGTIGYFSDRDYPADFFQTQYALSPLLVTKGTGQNFVIGNFYDPNFFQKSERLKELKIIRKFNDGLVLMTRSSK